MDSTQIAQGWMGAGKAVQTRGIAWEQVGMGSEVIAWSMDHSTICVWKSQEHQLSLYLFQLPIPYLNVKDSIFCEEMGIKHVENCPSVVGECYEPNM